VFSGVEAPISLFTGRGRRAGHKKGIKTMTIKSNSFGGFATLVLAVLPLVVIVGSLAPSL
jgi:hypothetical protein